MKLLLGWERLWRRATLSAYTTSPEAGRFRSSRAGNSNCPARRWKRCIRCAANCAHLAQVHQVAQPLGIGFLGVGMAPKWSRADMPMMPKGRYRIMTAYMPKVGKFGLDMMYRTCTVQTNLDFSSNPTW